MDPHQRDVDLQRCITLLLCMKQCWEYVSDYAKNEFWRACSFFWGPPYPGLKPRVPQWFKGVWTHRYNLFTVHSSYYKARLEPGCGSWSWSHERNACLQHLYEGVLTLVKCYVEGWSGVSTLSVVNDVWYFAAVLRIHEILVWFRIRGSIPRDYRNGSGSCYFHQ